MERTTGVPPDWLNKNVRVEAYSGDPLRPSASSEGVSEPSALKVRSYIGRLVHADATGLVLVLPNERSIFLSAGAILSVEPSEE